ncbi:MAG: hypothetical protein AAFW83_09075 [Pseudomonadota bacterium]
MLEVSARFAYFPLFFDEHQPFALQLFYAGFIGCDHTRVRGLDDAIEQFLDLMLNVLNIALESLFSR